MGYKVKNGKIISVTGASTSKYSVGDAYRESGPAPSKAPKAIAPTADAPLSNISGPYDAATGKLKTDIATSTPKVDTSQPSPQAPVNNFNAQTGKALAPGEVTTDALGNNFTQGTPFKTGFEQTKSSGTPPPTTMGGAASTIQNSVGPTSPPPSPLTSIVETDNTFDSIFSAYDDFFAPVKQKQSLLQEYKSFEKSLGINAMNEELINSKKIIEGTEDDIRSEVQAVSGFATDSQVLALSNARNKSLVKNYNYLLESRDSAMTQLNTMMNLSIQDRQMAEQEFDRKMNFTFKVQEFKERAVANAREGYNNTLKLMGADGMYNALLATGDPQAMALAERTLGVPQGGLAIAAQQAVKARSQEDTMFNLDVEGKKANIRQSNASTANSYDAIRERRENAANTGTLNGKPQNASQSTANSYANRMAEANISINNLGNKFTGKFSQLPAFNFMKSSDRQVYEQAQKNFITAVLRRESGAAIAESEFDTARDVYFPKPGDTSDVVKQKASTRNTVINNFYREANVTRPVSAGDIVESNGQQYKVGVDGETLTEI